VWEQPPSAVYSIFTLPGQQDQRELREKSGSFLALEDDTKETIPCLGFIVFRQT
jgi:hypothetical protein